MLALLNNCTIPNVLCVFYYFRMKATILADIDLFPLEQYDNGTLPMVNGDVFCINSTGAPSSIGLTLSKSSLVSSSRLTSYFKTMIRAIYRG